MTSKFHLDTKYENGDEYEEKRQNTNSIGRNPKPGKFWYRTESRTTTNCKRSIHIYQKRDDDSQTIWIEKNNLDKRISISKTSSLFSSPVREKSKKGDEEKR